MRLLYMFQMNCVRNLHLLYAFQPKNRKEDVLDKDKDNEVPKFIRRKIKSA